MISTPGAEAGATSSSGLPGAPGAAGAGLPASPGAATAAGPFWARLTGAAAGVALGIVFLIAALAKGGDPVAFIEQIDSYGIVSGWMTRFVAWTLVPFELVLAAALIVGLRRRLAAVATAGLLVFFIAVTAWAWSQGRIEKGCGCFGALSASRGPGDVIVEDILLIGLAGLATFPWRRGRGGPARAPAGAPAARSGGPSAANILRGAVVAGAALGGVAFQAAAPRLPLDDYVTALRPGRSVEALDLGLEKEARGLVALLDLQAWNTGEAVTALNELQAGSGGSLRIVAFAAATEEERGEFFWKFGPLFELREASRGTMRPLYRTLPRYFWVQDGRVVRTWNDRPPVREELAGLTDSKNN